MTDCKIYIAIVEHSYIICEGLSNILLKSDHHSQVFRFESLQELSEFPGREKLNMVIINPSFAISDRKDFFALRKSLKNAKWLGLIYSYFDKKIIELFDDTIEISYDPSDIKKIISKISKEDWPCLEEDQVEELSEREKDVLIELVNGFSNKEIAEKLNISTHTVASHRKNITSKIGVKSLAGLTIYSITKGIISLEDL